MQNSQVAPVNSSERQSKVSISTTMHLKQIVEVIVEGLPVTIVMSLFTIWALFSDDIRLSATTKEADTAFTVIISIAFFLFLLEIFAVSFYKEGYLKLPNF
jgi:hypothetical protein